MTHQTFPTRLLPPFPSPITGRIAMVDEVNDRARELPVRDPGTPWPPGSQPQPLGPPPAQHWPPCGAQPPPAIPAARLLPLLQHELPLVQLLRQRLHQRANLQAVHAGNPVHLARESTPSPLPQGLP